MEKQMTLQLDVKIPQARKLNGEFATQLTSAIEHAANWKQLYLAEVTRKYYVAQKMRLLEEENIRLKKLLEK